MYAPHVLYTTPVEYLVSIRQCGSLELLFDRGESVVRCTLQYVGMQVGDCAFHPAEEYWKVDEFRLCYAYPVHRCGRALWVFRKQVDD